MREPSRVPRSCLGILGVGCDSIPPRGLIGICTPNHRRPHSELWRERECGGNRPVGPGNAKRGRSLPLRIESGPHDGNPHLHLRGSLHYLLTDLHDLSCVGGQKIGLNGVQPWLRQTTTASAVAPTSRGQAGARRGGHRRAGRGRAAPQDGNGPAARRKSPSGSPSPGETVRHSLSSTRSRHRSSTTRRSSCCRCNRPAPSPHTSSTSRRPTSGFPTISSPPDRRSRCHRRPRIAP